MDRDGSFKDQRVRLMVRARDWPQGAVAPATLLNPSSASRRG